MLQIFLAHIFVFDMEGAHSDLPNYNDKSTKDHNAVGLAPQHDRHSVVNREWRYPLKYTLARENDPFGVVDQKLVDLAQLENMLLELESVSDSQRVRLQIDLDMKKREIMDVLKQMLPGPLSGTRAT